jgi:hypothetical protein
MRQSVGKSHPMQHHCQHSLLQVLHLEVASPNKCAAREQHMDAAG